MNQNHNPNQLPPISEKLSEKPVHKFMTKNVITARRSTSILQAMDLMVSHKISGLPVLDDNDKLVGVFSEMDAILQAASKPITAKIECPNPRLLTCYPDTPFKEALILLIKNKLKRMPVINVNKQVVGIVTRYDFMRAYMQDHRKNLPSIGPGSQSGTARGVKSPTRPTLPRKKS